MEGYNGWENYETWNVALWIQNDEFLWGQYRRARDYRDFVLRVKELGIEQTPDEVFYADACLDIGSLDARNDD